MPAVQTSYSERHGYAVEGMIADSVPFNVVTRICETAAGIGFGKAVSRGSGDRGAIIGGTVAGFDGVTVKDITLLNTTPDKYAQYDRMGVLEYGMIYVLAGSNVADKDPVYFNPTTGAFSNAGGAATVGTPSGAGNAGGGTCTLADPAYGASVKAGTYTVILRDVVSGGGIWDVIRPDGTIEGQAVVGAAYTGSIKFTIADGTPDFAAGDKFTVAVTLAAVGPIPGATWVDTVDSGALARIYVRNQR